MGRSDLTVEDDFFKLGGTSLQALRLFSAIQKKWGKNLPPATLLKNRTVRQLSALLMEGDHDLDWKNLVPLNNTGDKPPIFCIHAGGAHVFAYRELADHFKDERQVFGIQPHGLDDAQNAKATIREITKAYLKEIRQVTDEVIVIGYCFGAAVAYEMCHVLDEADLDKLTVIIVDSAPGLTYGRPKEEDEQKLRKLIRIIRLGQWQRLKEILWDRMDKIKVKYFSFTESPQMRTFRKLERILSRVYLDFEWRPSTHTIHLIRSSEYKNRSDKHIHVIEWEKLIGKNLRMYEVEGEHIELFKPPVVSKLARTINEVPGKLVRTVAAIRDAKE